MTAKQRENCIKVKTALEDIYDNGNLNRYRLKPYEAYAIANHYNKIVNTGKSVSTIVEGVMNFFKSYGFTTKETGIGWTISL